MRDLNISVISPGLIHLRKGFLPNKQKKKTFWQGSVHLGTLVWLH